jgi:hypothetical protein
VRCFLERAGKLAVEGEAERLNDAVRHISSQDNSSTRVGCAIIRRPSIPGAVILPPCDGLAFRPFGHNPIAFCGRLDASNSRIGRLYSECGIPAPRKFGVASFRIFQWVNEFEGENYWVRQQFFQKEGAQPVKSYMWSRLYVNAILETDCRKLPQRIREAEWAIQERFSSSLLIDGAERELLTGARARLTSLKTGRLAKTA